MYKLIFTLYSILILSLLLHYIFKYLVNKKEPLGPLPGDELCSNNQTSSASTNIVLSSYLTNNNLNYDLVDYDIDMIERQYNNLKYCVDNFKFKIGDQVVTGPYTTTPTSISFGGNYPNNINLHFTFPLVLDGPPGDKGDKGNKGKKGSIGQKGQRGNTGSDGICSS